MPGSISPDLPVKGEPLGSSDAKLKGSIITLRDALNAVLNAENKVPILGTWYSPKIIAAEETRESTSYGTMSTADEITGVVLPANGIIRIRYAAIVKGTVPTAARVGLFLNSTQIGNGTESIEVFPNETSFTFITTGGGPAGLVRGVAGSTFPATGVAMVPIDVFAAAGTYSVSARFKASSGSVTAKERKLFVEVLGT